MDRTLLHKVRQFLTYYMTFSVDTYADICSLWAIGSHVFKSFDAFPYMVITAATKRSGKTRLAELLAMVSYNPQFFAAMTPSAMFHIIGDGATIFFDEAEELSSEAAGVMRSVLNVGYRRGQTVPRMAGNEVVKYEVYSPKAFILIGDVHDTLRDRSIVIEMIRTTPPNIFRFTEAEEMAKQAMSGFDSKALATWCDNGARKIDPYSFLEGREAEIWTPILALAEYFKLDINRIAAAAADMASLKASTDAKRFAALRQSAEKKASQDGFNTQAMKDLAFVLNRDGVKAIHTETAIQAMKAIPTSPWRTYKGDGLSAVMLSDLVSPFGVVSKNIRIGSLVKRGFNRDNVIAGLAKMEKN